MPLFHETSKIAILGITGCGKTHLSREIQKLFPRAVIIDVVGEYSDGIVCNSFEEFTDAIVNSLNQYSFRIIFRGSLDSSDEDEEINHCIRLAMLRSVDRGAVSHGLLLVLEEVSDYSSTHYMPQYMGKNYRRGRHFKVATLATSQRPGDVHKRILSQSDLLFAGNCTDLNDVKWLATRLGWENSNKLISLPFRQFLLHNLADNSVKLVGNTLK